MADPGVNKPALLFTGSQIAIGGAQKALLTTAEWFHARGYPVQAAFYYDRDNLLEEWQKQYPFPIVDLNAVDYSASKTKQAAMMVSGARKLRHLMRQQSFGAVFSYTHHSNLITMPVARLAGVPLCFPSHHGVIQDFPAWQDKLHTAMVNSSLATRLIAVSEKTRQQSIDAGIKPEKIIIIRNGVSIPVPQPAEIEALTAEPALRGRYPLLLSVGRLTEQKGHTHLLKALPALCNRFPNLLTLIAGDGPLRAELEAEARTLGIAENVLFLGFRDDIPALMHVAQVFVLPSVSEGLPFAILEALGQGKAVVSSGIAGIEEVIDDGVHGLLIPPGDPAAITQAVTRLLEDPAFAKTLGTAGRQRVMAEFTIDAMCQHYEALLKLSSAERAQ